MTSSIAKYAALLRLPQWSKNLFVLTPLFFSGKFMEWNRLLPCLAGFLLFGFAASMVYIVNDICDLQADRLHPEKRKRPLADGTIEVTKGKYIAWVLFLASFIPAYFLSVHFVFILLAYAAISFSYSFGLKNIPLLDIFLVSFGFVLRLMAGQVLGDIVISNWLYIMTVLLAVFMAIAKRRDDLLILNDTGINVRKASRGYSLEFIHTAMSIMAAVLVVAYLQYVTAPEVTSRFGNSYLFASTLFVLMGILRYLQITMVEEKSGSPTRIFLFDPFIQLCIVGWLMFFIVLIYLK